MTRQLHPKAVLELGPYDGRDSVSISEHCERLICIEGRAENVLLTELALLSHKSRVSSFEVRHGEIRESLESWDFQQKLDLIWASGVLYHFEDPLRIIALLAGICGKNCCPVVGWTHLADRPECEVNGYSGLWYTEDPQNSDVSSIKNERSLWLTPDSFRDAFLGSGFDSFRFLDDPSPAENGGLSACFAASLK